MGKTVSEAASVALRDAAIESEEQYHQSRQRARHCGIHVGRSRFGGRKLDARMTVLVRSCSIEMAPERCHSGADLALIFNAITRNMFPLTPVRLNPDVPSELERINQQA